jgi:hypothetical protein
MNHHNIIIHVPKNDHPYPFDVTVQVIRKKLFQCDMFKIYVY